MIQRDGYLCATTQHTVQYERTEVSRSGKRNSTTNTARDEARGEQTYTHSSAGKGCQGRGAMMGGVHKHNSGDTQAATGTHGDGEWRTPHVP